FIQAADYDSLARRGMNKIIVHKIDAHMCDALFALCLKENQVTFLQTVLTVKQSAGGKLFHCCPYQIGAKDIFIETLYKGRTVYTRSVIPAHTVAYTIPVFNEIV